MPSINPEWEVSVQDVKNMLDSRAAMLLLDVRERDEYQTCRIEGAQLVPMSEIQNRAEEIKALAGGKTVVCHCHHGGRSLKAAQFLRAAGIAGVKSMAGGIEVWSTSIDPSVPRY